MSGLSARERRERLEDAMRRGAMVRLRRRFEDGAIDGYVAAIGQRWVMIALVSDRIRYDGFEVFRLSDVEQVKGSPNAEFVERALELRGEGRPDAAGISLDSLEDLLRTAGERFALVTIHEEAHDPDVCWVGRLQDVDSQRLWLLEIGPDAAWRDEVSVWRLAQITRVGFGAEYEKALELVGGAPPNERKAPPPPPAGRTVH